MARDANRMSEAVAKLAGVFADHVSVTVTYSRSGSSLGGISATISVSRYDVEQDGMVTAWEIREYLVAATSLVLDGVQIAPQVGDRMTQGADDVYEVLDVPGQGCWQWADGMSNVRQIHTKRVGA